MFRTTDVIADERGRGQARPCVSEPRSLRLALRIRPARDGRKVSDFATLLEELEERCLAQENAAGCDGDIRTVIVRLWSNKRAVLESTLEKHGYQIKDEFEL